MNLPPPTDPDFLALKQSCKEFLLEWYKQYYMHQFSYTLAKAEYEAHQRFEENVVSGQDLSLKHAQKEYLRQKSMGQAIPKAENANWTSYFAQQQQAQQAQQTTPVAAAAYPYGYQQPVQLTSYYQQQMYPQTAVQKQQAWQTRQTQKNAEAIRTAEAAANAAMQMANQVNEDRKRNRFEDLTTAIPPPPPPSASESLANDSSKKRRIDNASVSQSRQNGSLEFNISQDRQIATQLKHWEKQTKQRIKMDSGYRKFVGAYGKMLAACILEKKQAIWQQVEEMRAQNLPIEINALMGQIGVVDHELVHARSAKSKSKSKASQQVSSAKNNTTADTATLLQRARRFQNGSDNKSSIGGTPRSLNWMEKLELLSCTEKVVGRNTNLEKEYLRLTSVPDPATVRPFGILKKALPFVLTRYEARGDDWRYLESQLKSIRQDLTVQGIRNTFAINVYEENCLRALDHDDLGQYNQAQTQLFYLYEDAVKERSSVILSKKEKFDPPTQNYKSGLRQFDEFICLRLLYLALNDMAQDLIKVLSSLDKYETATARLKDQWTRSSIGYKFANAIMESLRCNNYVRLFKLMEKAPYRHANVLISLYMPRLRMKALLQLARGSHILEFETVTQALRFEEEIDCVEWFLDVLGEKNVAPHKIIRAREEGGKLEFLGFYCKKGINNVIAGNALIAGKKMKAMG